MNTANTQPLPQRCLQTRVSWLNPTVLGIGLASVLLATTIAKADLVTEWNSLLLEAIRTEDASPTLAARSLAILHTAIYDAVNAVYRTHQPYFVDIVPPPGTDAEAAAVAAAYEVMVNLYPSQRGRYDGVLSGYLAGVPGGKSRDGGLGLGKSVADAILAWRSNDGASTSVPYIPSTAPGQWRRTPPFYRPPDSPQCPFVIPFAMSQGSQFRQGGPPALSGRQYAAEFNQVKELGATNSTTRTADQTQIARFWSDFSYTVTPPGHWNWIAAIVATNRNNSVQDNARMFALLNIALADAGIACWDNKYTYNFWRPVTAIRTADIDGNPDTISDPEWNSLLITPPFPEYTSGHSTFSRTAATVLGDFLGTDLVSFTVGCDALPGVFRSYSGLSSAAEECGWSRIYGGIHFRSADVDGQASGAGLAHYVTSNFLLPVASLPRLRFVGFTAGQAQVHLQGLLNRYYVIQATSDFSAWLPILTNTTTRGGVVLSDPASTGFVFRFYRAVELGLNWSRPQARDKTRL